MTDPRDLWIKCMILKETEKAIFLSLTDGRHEWFPKSTITSSLVSKQFEAHRNHEALY